VCKHHNGRKASIVPLIAILLLCLLSSILPFGAHSRTASAADSVFYDFITQAPSASWSSGAGSLPFPSSDSDSRGFALYRDNWQLEDNNTWARVLETHPQWVSNGWIMGLYPEVTVPSNAELKVTVGFFKGATGSDGVTFEVKFEEFLGLQVAPKIYSILSHRATYDGKLDFITTELSSIEGKTGNFVLYANAGQSSGQDWAAWAEAKIEAPSDTTAPEVTISHSPSEVTTADTVTFTAQARDDTSVVNILIFVNGQQVKECTPPSQKTDGEGGKYWECVYTGGPYGEGTLTYRAEAVDSYENQGGSSEESVDVTLTITPVEPPVTLCWFSISGTIHNFPYADETLKIEVCEAETILAEIDGTTVPITTCKEGGRVWRVDTNRLFSGDLPGPDLTYQVNRLCPGRYIVAPVYQPGVDLCEWHGSWQTAKGQVVTIEDSNAEGFDFTFEPEDSSAPRVSSITANPAHPELSEDVVITILTQDDGEIAAIWEKTDIVFNDGSVHAGYWHSLTVSPGMLGSTAGAQFSLTDDRIMQATVTAKVCDSGGNSHMAQITVQFGSCNDEIQNQGETGIDCGGPCPSKCINCLGDDELGDNPSAYLYSPDHWDTIRMWADTALSEYASNHSLSLLELDTSDEMMDAIAWWVMKHMSYRADGFNQRINDNLHLGYDPFGDYAHYDFPQPAYYTISSSWRWRSTMTYTDDKGELHTWNPPADSEKWFFGDCEDFGVLQVALLRSLGVSHRCVFNVEEPTHSTTIIYYKGKYRIRDYGAITYDDIWVDNLWNDKIGAFCGYQGIADGSFTSVNPWEYTMNYPGCESPRIDISGGGFGAKRLWLDWAGWGRNKIASTGDMNGDGRDDIIAVRYDHEERTFFADELLSTGTEFDETPARLADGDEADFLPIVGKREGDDFLVVFYPYLAAGPHLWCVEGTDCPARFDGYDIDAQASVVRLGDPDGDGYNEVVEFLQGEGGNVTVAGRLWRRGFSLDGEIPFVGDFDGDGADDIITFIRGESGDVWVARSRLRDFCWASYKWHDNFCLDEEIPLVGDFNGDGRDDIVTFKQDTGNVFVALSTIFGFWGDGWLWKDDFCYEGDIPLVGDFNGDGRDDIASLREHDGRVSIWVALSNPSSINYVFADPECNLCQVPFFQDAYFPSKCP
jgi:hypothetical protein